MLDQANKLRAMVNNTQIVEKSQNHNIKIYSVVSGKGGVGKTNFVINAAIKFRQMGKKVLILDADIGMSNANILLGIQIPHSLFEAIQGDVTLQDVIVKSPYGIDIISGGADFFYMENLDTEKQHQIVEDLSKLGEYDILLIDNGAGISKQSLTFTILADEIILVTTPEPTALTDAYRVLKAVSTYNLKNKVKVVINQIHDISAGEDAYNKLLKTSQQFLKVKLEKTGCIFNDIRMNKAIMDQCPIVLKFPNALASNNISQICTTILEDKSYDQNISTMKQLSNRLIRLFG